MRCQHLVEELEALALAGSTGMDESLNRVVARRDDLYGESYWAGVREGQRVISERLRHVLEHYSDLHC